MSEIPTTPVQATARRDALGQTCFVLHLAVMIFIVFGWALPSRILLGFYLAFLPAVVVQWQFNKNSCVLNNVESLLRTGRWRDSKNPEEGAWLQALVRSVTGIEISAALLDGFVHLVLIVFWGLALGHLLRG